MLAIKLDTFAAELQRESMYSVNAKNLFRFPLPATDMRIAYGTPDQVQGLEAEVVVVAHSHGEPLTVASVRDLYVAVSRARSHLIFVGSQSPQQLRIGGAAAFQAGVANPDPTAPAE